MRTPGGSFFYTLQYSCALIYGETVGLMLAREPMRVAKRIAGAVLSLPSNDSLLAAREPGGRTQ